MNLVVAPWDDPIQDGRGKEAKFMTYDIQYLRKNFDVTPIKDIGTLDPVKTQSPGGVPVTKKP